MDRRFLVLGMSIFVLLSVLMGCGKTEGRSSSAHKNATAAYTAGDYAKAMRLLRPLAEQGYAKAQHNLGVMYHNGEGVPKDDAEAAKWYRKAAEQGYAKAQGNLGTMYYYGEGVPQDDAEAEKWYRKAAEQGYAKAQGNLGHMYYYGKGVPKDYAEAAKWYRKAAEQGDARAQHDLGVMYEKGFGVPQDDAEAEKWYRKAAERGDEGAQKKVMIYDAGRHPAVALLKSIPCQTGSAKWKFGDWMSAGPDITYSVRSGGKSRAIVELSYRYYGRVPTIERYEVDLELGMATPLTVTFIFPLPGPNREGKAVYQEQQLTWKGFNYWCLYRSDVLKPYKDPDGRNNEEAPGK